MAKKKTTKTESKKRASRQSAPAKQQDKKPESKPPEPTDTKTIGAAAEMWVHEGKECIRMKGNIWSILLVRTPGTYVYDVRVKRLSTSHIYRVKGWVIPYVGTWYKDKRGPVCRGTIHMWDGSEWYMSKSRDTRYEIMEAVWAALRYNHRKRLEEVRS